MGWRIVRFFVVCKALLSSWTRIQHSFAIPSFFVCCDSLFFEKRRFFAMRYLSLIPRSYSLASLLIPEHECFD